MPRNSGWLLRLLALAIPAISLAQQTPAVSYRVSTVAGTSSVGDGGPALSAQLSAVEGLAIDLAGNLYISDNTDHRVRKVTPSGVISTIAGTGTAGPGPNHGVAVETELNSPYGLAVDYLGNVYIADFGNARVRRVAPDGTIRTVAGGGVLKVADGADALLVRLGGPRNVAVDAAGVLYISDYTAHRVYRVTTDGKITAIAGTGEAGFNGDGPAVASQLKFPAGLAASGSGALIIADSGNKLVRLVRDGTIRTIAGDNPEYPLASPTGIALSPDGHVFIADGVDNRICVTGAFGSLATAAGAGGIRLAGNPGTPLAGPTRDLAMDAAGTLFIADGRRVLRKFTGFPSEFYAGDGRFGESRENIAATEARLAGPIGVALDAQGGLYIVEERGQRVRRIGADGKIRTAMGGGTGPSLGDGGSATAARLLDPVGIAVDSWGGVRVADHLGNRVRGVTSSGLAFTAAGDGTAGWTGDSGAAQSGRVNRPRGLAFDLEGNLYIADSLNHRIRKIGANGIMTTVAGSGTRGFFGDGGRATQAQLNTPQGVFADAAGNLFIADSGNHAIRKITRAGIITTVAGSGAQGYAGDNGPAILASFSTPTAVAADAAGNLFIADTFNNRIRRVALDGTVATVAGDGAPGYSGDGGFATATRFRSPSSIAIDHAGRIYIADLDNHRVRLLTPEAVSHPPDPGLPSQPAEVTADLVVMNAASFRSGPVARGQLVSLFHAAIPAEGATVRINGRDSAVLAAVAGQLNTRIPEDAGAAADVAVFAAGKLVARAQIPVADAAPGLFTMQHGVGQAIAVHEDGTLNSALNPAPRGSIVVLYATGHGDLDVDGKAKLPVQLRVGNTFADILYAGAAPGFAGVMQVNAKLPGIFTAPGTHTVSLSIGASASQAGVTLTLR